MRTYKESIGNQNQNVNVMITTNERSTSTAIHLSTFTQYFIPFGNFIFPVIIWSTLKQKSAYIDQQGRQAINFQLSMFLYSIILAVIAIPILIINVLKGIEFSQLYHHRHDLFHENFNPENISTIVIVAVIAVMLFCILKVSECLLVIIAALKSANGESYSYPMTINFLGKTLTETPTQENQETDPQLITEDPQS